VRIQFYVPSNYAAERLKNTTHRFPVVVNFHGGGFTIGTATDDARWASAVVDQVGAVVASVDYRLAPEHPFPTAVEDGVDALIYIARHANELGLDADRIAVSGFSAGGNMAFTVPLRLQEELQALSHFPSPTSSASTSTSDTITTTTENTSPSNLLPNTIHANAKDMRAMHALKIAAIVAWYPSADYTLTREQRRLTNPRRDQELPAIFTTLFDESYLQPPAMDRASPYLSPALAPAAMLAALPDHILLYTCQWDVLRAEARSLQRRLEQEAGKKVRGRMVKEVPHGWDKSPNPWRVTNGVGEAYGEACGELRRIFGSEGLVVEDGGG